MTHRNLYQSGLHSVGNYQVSGIPWVSGSIPNCKAVGIPFRIQFPSVTRWIIVKNRDDSTTTSDMVVAFSENGLPSKGGTNYYKLHDPGAGLIDQTRRLELKVSEIWMEGVGNGSELFDVIAGLTGIPTTEIIDNWSGSAGVG